MKQLRLRLLGACAAVLAITALATCGREPVAPHFRAGLAVEPVLPPGFDLQAFGLVIDGVRIIAINSAHDTVFNKLFPFPTNQSSVSVQADIPMAQSPETFDITIEELAGTVVLFTGTQTVSVTSGSSNTPAQVPVAYSGPGQNVASLTLGPLDSSLTQGGSLQFRVSAKDGQNANVPNFYVSWSTSDTVAAPIDATGTIKAPLLRRTVTVKATTPNAVSATTTLQFIPALTSLVFDSGCAQSGLPGAQLAQPIVAKVVGSDGLGVQGVTVNFSAPATGLVASASTTTDTGGRARTLVTLPTTAGPAVFQAAVTGLTTATCAQTATGGTASTLVFTTQPANITAGTAMPPIVVTVKDVGGNTVTSFTGNVTLTLGSHPAGVVLTGSTTVAAVAGVATFNLGGFTVAGGYTLVASSSGLQSVVSNSFTVNPAPPVALAFIVQPTSQLAGAIITPPVVVAVEDSVGNVVNASGTSITMGFAVNPSGQGTLGGGVTKTSASGLATFTDLSVAIPASGYKLGASASGLTTATSAAFDVAVRPPGITWVNPAGGNWSTPANWSPARVPGPTDTVSIISNTALSVTLDINAHVAFLVVGDTIGAVSFTFAPGRRLDIDSTAGTLRGGLIFLQASDTLGGPGSFNNQGVLSLFNSAVTLPFLSNTGTIEVEGNALFTGSFGNSQGSTLAVEGSSIGDATLTVSSSFLNAGGIVLTNIDPSVAHNATLSVTTGSVTNILGGVITTVAGGSTTGARTLQATLINQGLVLVEQTLTLDQAAATHANSGVISLQGGDLDVVLSGFRPAFTNGASGVVDVGTNKLVVSGTGSFGNAAGGTLEGSGTIDASGAGISFITNGATTVGGGGPGILQFLGPYLSGPDTNTTLFNVRIGGSPTNPGVDFDQFRILGAGAGANLQGGTLNVTPIATAVGSYPIITLPVGQVFSGDFLAKHIPVNCTATPSGNQYVVTCT